MHAFDVLRDPVRRRILELLVDRELASGEVAAVIEREFAITQAAVSQHLKVLRDSGFATVRVDGARRIYAVDTGPLRTVDTCSIASGTSGSRSSTPWRRRSREAGGSGGSPRPRAPLPASCATILRMTAEGSFDTDVLVVGGGPAGSAAATMLARKGWRVRLYERDRFPREHVGESLLPASMPVLAELGVLPAIEAAGFLPKYGATMVWGRDPDPWSWTFRESSPRYPHAYQVVRSQFDDILLRNAAAHGADVREGCRVLEAEAGPDGATLRVEDGEGRWHTARARFVVDASGQAGLIGRARNLREADPFFRNLAVYGYYGGGSRLPEPDVNNILIESIEDGWLWAIPLHTGLVSTGVVVDSAAGRERISELGPERFFRERVAGGPHTSALLAGATLTGSPTIVRDWSYSSSELAGEGFVLAGDAACFVDPLFSSGVHLALSSGVLAAAYVTSALKDPELGKAAAAVYAQQYRQQYDHFREMAASSMAATEPSTPTSGRPVASPAPTSRRPPAWPSSEPSRDSPRSATNAPSSPTARPPQLRRGRERRGAPPRGARRRLRRALR